MDELELENVITNKKVLPLLYYDETQGPITKNNLQFNDWYIEMFRNNDRTKRAEENNERTHDVNGLNQALTDIFKEETNNLYKIRAIINLIMMKNYFNVVQTFAFLITEDLGAEAIANNNCTIYKHNNLYFNDIFYNQIKSNKYLILNLVEIMQSSVKSHSLLYDYFYPIMNKIILANESSMTPIDPNQLKFMDEIDVKEKFKRQIIDSYPIILPFHIKYALYIQAYTPCPTITISVDRDNILDAIWNLDLFENCNIQLRIQFKKENGIDAGGLRREFNYLAFTTLMKPETDLFEERNGFYWFKSHKEMTDELKRKYKCVGILLGISILNRLTIPIHFPPYFYKKLLHKDIYPSDLNSFDPELFFYLKEYMKMDTSENDENAIDFIYVDNKSGNEIDLRDYTYIDDSREVDKVTNKNKNDFIIRTAEWVFNKSIEKEFAAFEEGFKRINTNKMLYTYFRIDEIDKIVSGDNELNWNKLKDSAKYSNGFNRFSKTIVWFWNYFDNLPDDKKFEAIKFITGTTSVPPGGLGDIHIKFNKASCAYPVSHTCFSTIDLPNFQSFDELKDKCSEAFANSEFGFG